jgi:hypothetical protein
MVLNPPITARRCFVGALVPVTESCVTGTAAPVTGTGKTAKKHIFFQIFSKIMSEFA